MRRALGELELFDRRGLDETPIQCSYESGPSACRRTIPRYRGSESFKVYAVDSLPATTDFCTI